MKKESIDRLYFLLTILDYCVACSYLAILVVFKLLTLPLSLAKSLMSVGIESEDNKTEVTMINAIREWVVNHQNDITDAAETFGDDESYFIKITPKLASAATLQIEIGFPKYLRISVNNLGIEFYDNDIEDGAKLIQKILLSYENGKYYIQKWLYHDVVVDQCLVFNIDKNKDYQSKSDEFKMLRKFFSKAKRKKFLPIAFDTLTTATTL